MKESRLPEWLNKNEIKAIYELLERLETRLDILDCRMYGSKARGDYSQDSDLDLMILLPKKTAVIKSFVRHETFETNLVNDTAISTIIFDRIELDDGPMSESPLYKRIMKEGVPIDRERKTA
jgi:uncharacterized protein